MTDPRPSRPPRRRLCEECGRPMAHSLDRIRAVTHPGCYEHPGPDEDTTTWPPDYPRPPPTRRAADRPPLLAFSARTEPRCSSRSTTS